MSFPKLFVIALLFVIAMAFVILTQEGSFLSMATTAHF